MCKNHSGRNKNMTRLLSILNSKGDKEAEIFTLSQWINPDDLSANKVTVTFSPKDQMVSIRIIQNLP